METRLKTFTRVAALLLASLKIYWPYCIMALGYLVFFWHYIWPIWGDTLYTNAGDLPYRVRWALSAKHAIEQGQFSYTNDTPLALQPSFLYDSPLFLFISGLVQIILKINAYKGILISVCLFSGLGLLGTYGSLRTMNCHKICSALGAVSFLFTPYFITDITTRTAFEEVAAFGCFPIVLWSFLEFSRYPHISRLCFLFLSIALFLLAHKIFIAWASVLMALLCLLLYGLHRSIRIIALYAGCLTAAMCFTSYYWLNSFLNVKYLYIANLDLTPYFETVGKLHNVDLDGPVNALRITWSFLTADFSVFYPFEYSHPTAHDPHLLLQVGPLITIALLMSVFYVRRDKNLRAVLAVTVLSTIVACSLFYVVPFWKYMPTPLVIIQFPYRMLLFSCVFGSILVGLVLDNANKQKSHFVYVALGIAAATQCYNFSYVPKLTNLSSSTVEAADFFNNDYWEPGGRKLESSSTPASLAQTEPFTAQIKGQCARMIVVARTEGAVALPVLYSRLLNVQVDGKPIESFNVAKQAVVNLSVGVHHIKACRREPIKYQVAVFAGAIVFLSIIIGMRLAGALKASGSNSTPAPRT